MDRVNVDHGHSVERVKVDQCDLRERERESADITSVWVYVCNGENSVCV